MGSSLTLVCEMCPIGLDIFSYLSFARLTLVLAVGSLFSCVLSESEFVLEKPLDSRYALSTVS